MKIDKFKSKCDKKSDLEGGKPFSPVVKCIWTAKLFVVFLQFARMNTVIRMKNGFIPGLMAGGVRPTAAILFFFLFIFLVSCSGKKVPPPPRAQPELLLEIYDLSRKREYNSALAKVQKMRALEPTNTFLADLEGTIRFNIMTAEVNKRLQNGDFDSALNSIQRYETLFGSSAFTTAAKNRLFVFAEVNSLIGRARTTVKPEELEKILVRLNALSKEINFSSKVTNFLQDQVSMLNSLRKMERDRMLFGVREDAIALFKAGDVGSASVFTAAYALEAPGDPGINELLYRMKVSGL